MAIDLTALTHPTGVLGTSGIRPPPPRVAPPFGTPPAPAVIEVPPPEVPGEPGIGPPGGSPGGSCPPGTYFDPVLGGCVLLPGGLGLGGTFGGETGGTSVTGTTVTTPGSETAGEGPITVNVNNAVTVADQSASNAVQNVATAVRGAVISAATTANTIAQNTQQTVSNQLTALTDTLGNEIIDAQNNIGNVVNGITADIGSTLGGIGNTIGQSIFGAINPVTVGLAQIVGIIAQQIGGLGGAIASAVARVIPLIIEAVNGQISPVTAVIGVLSGQINQQIAALSQLGSDIGGGFGSLDSTLQRILTSYEGFTEAQTGYPEGGSLHHDLSNLAAAIAGIATNQQYTAQPKLADFLSAPCVTDYLEKLRQTPWKPPDEPMWLLEEPEYLLAKFFASIVSWAFTVFPAAQKAAEGGKQIMDEQCPQGLLSPGQLVEAVQRGFLQNDNALQEALRGNLSGDRFRTLQDLAVEQLPASQLVEALYRGLITQANYFSALQAQGFTGDQQEILKGIAGNLLSVGELIELVRRGTIDQGTQDTALKVLRYDDAQRKALQSLTFRPANMSEAIGGSAGSDALDGLLPGGAGSLSGIPEFIQAAAAAEGLSVDAANARWFDHWTVGSIGLWIDLYFRGQASLQQLQAVMRRSFIPDALHSSIVNGARPLIQFRTISRMVFLKLLTPEQGRAQLLKHGYSQEDADTLINYALVSGKAPAAQRAQTAHAVSIGIAKEEYIDGSITAAQFYDILIAHNFTPNGAETEIAVINAHEAMLARKAAAQLIVDEYGAGLINEQVALAQLAAQGLTVAELAKYAHKIRAFRVKNAKLPTEAELKKMLKANLITADIYKSTLLAEGYPQGFVDAFYALDSAVPVGTAPVSSSATPAP